MKRLISFLITFLTVFGCFGILSDADALENPVVPNGTLGEFRHGTFPSPPLGDFTHVGVDIVARCGSDIYTFADGKVRDIISTTNDRNFNTLGYMAIIEHPASLKGETFYTLYLHMQSPPDVNLGEQVQGGKTKIGKVGNTGKAFGCHTHFEIRYFPERLSAWGNIYGKGDQKKSEYFKLNWGDPFVFFSKYPKGLVLDQSNKRSNKAVVNSPKFLGKYAVSKGDLIELKSHPQSSTRGFTIGGADILRSLSGIRLPNGIVEFIIYQQGVASLTELYVKKIARVRRQITYDFMTGKRMQGIKDFDRAFYIVIDEGFRLRLAPISKNPQMMVRAVLEKPLEGGIYALIFGGEMYDFVVEGGGEGCAERIIGRAGQVSYRKCDAKTSESGRDKKKDLTVSEEEKESKGGNIFASLPTKKYKINTLSSHKLVKQA